MQLFAERGFGATAVADIESKVGLQPRRGGMYKHFENKQALLEAGVHRDLARVRTMAAEISALDVDADAMTASSLRMVVMQLGRWFLDEMTRLESLTRVLEHDGHRMKRLLAIVRKDIVDLGYRTAANLVSTVAPGVDDPDAMAVVFVGSLAGYRRTTWTFDSPPIDVDDDRVLKAWTDTTASALEAARRRRPPDRLVPACRQSRS